MISQNENGWKDGRLDECIMGFYKCAPLPFSFSKMYKFIWIDLYYWNEDQKVWKMMAKLEICEKVTQMGVKKSKVKNLKP